jgi:hypothetical protein
MSPVASFCKNPPIFAAIRDGASFALKAKNHEPVTHQEGGNEYLGAKAAS